ncbi:MAG: DUF4250 domain-containing protein [Muribaculaceae bacterium]|nr:DUF4250 domain-containing protein [Muribaculaceae bacterium]
MSLPEDPNIIVSYINMKMRDGDYESLEELCDSLGYNVDEIKEKLSKAGFEYIPELKQFR